MSTITHVGSQGHHQYSSSNNSATWRVVTVLVPTVTTNASNQFVVLSLDKIGHEQ